jgi:hypothetical protein
MSRAGTEASRPVMSSKVDTATNHEARRCCHKLPVHKGSQDANCASLTPQEMFRCGERLAKKTSKLQAEITANKMQERSRLSTQQSTNADSSFRLLQDSKLFGAHVSCRGHALVLTFTQVLQFLPIRQELACPSWSKPQMLEPESSSLRSTLQRIHPFL